MENDQPLTPAGRLFLRPEMNQIITCVVVGKNPFDIDVVKSEINNSVMLKHPRFSSLLVRDSNGREYWRRVPEVNVDDHLIIHHEPLTNELDPSVISTDEDAINEYLADLSVSSPLSVDKPLWEIHLFMAHNCSVFRVHHALGDGISLMSMLLTCCRRVDDPTQLPTIGGVGSSSSSYSLSFWRVLKVAWYTLIFVIEFILRSLWLKDKRTIVSGGAGVELWPRKLATAKFSLDDMKIVKKAVTDATINDVLFGIISCGLSRYLDMRSPNALQEGLQMTGVAMVNLRSQSGLQELSKLVNGSNPGVRFGNQFGMMLLPVYYHKEAGNVLQFVSRAKDMIYRKKQSLEAPFSYKIGNFVMSWFGPKFASLLNYRIVCNTTFTISNIIGPREEVMLAGNPITSMRVNSTSLPHAITMHMMSYAGRAEMQILVAKDIIPDPQVLAKCFQDALLEMKELALANMKS